VSSQNAPQRKQSLRRNRIIPPEEDMRRLFQECKIGNGNAQLLSESLTFAKPEDLRKEIIRVRFLSRWDLSFKLKSGYIGILCKVPGLPGAYICADTVGICRR
jgi:hypothetical protein